MATPVQNKLGILGTGQLATMLAEECPALDIETELYTGKLNDDKSLTDFLRDNPVVTFESEFVDCAALEKARRQTQCEIRPSLSAIKVLQDKLMQKRLCEKLGIATSRFSVVEGDGTAWLKDAKQEWPKGCVLKWSRFGYDGKGVCLISDMNRADTNHLHMFIAEGRKRGAQIYAEDFVRYTHELAMVATRDENQTVYYPLVLSEQTEGICKYVRGPASALNIAPEIEAAAKVAMEKIGGELNYVGTFAVEFFLDSNKQLLVNEIAPRVHNSGHYSQDAIETSQFANHVRAVYGRGLKGVKAKRKFFGMINVLGPKDGIKSVVAPDREMPGIKFHWYDKADVRIGRKMGHINIFADTLGEFENLWQLGLKIDAHWRKTGNLTLEGASK